MKKLLAIVLFVLAMCIAAPSAYANDNTLLFNGSKYQFIEEICTWEEAQENCEKMGGHLVTVGSQEEQEFLSENCSGSMWIGSFRNTDNSWCWITGEAMDYTFWSNGEPYEEEEYCCVLLFDSKWYTYEYNFLAEGYICEWEDNECTSHTPVTDKAVAATCTKEGKTAGTHCSRCGKVLTAQKSVAALGHKVVTDKAVAPTCAKTGLTAGSHCSRCGKVIKAQQTVAKKEHTYTAKTVKATTDENGYTAKKCTVCGHISGKKTIYRVQTVKLSATGFTYDGKAKTPTVTVKDSNGTTLKKDSAYTVKYDTGRKEVGLYNVTVTLKGKYSGGEILTFKINPKGTAIGTLTAKSQGFDAKWSKQTTQTTGYQLQYATNSGFSSAKTVTVSKNTTVSKSFTGLKASTKYYVRIRTYKSVDGIKYCSAWSSTKTVTTQKAVSIKLNASSATIYTGGTKALKATLYPTEQTVTWKSSDTSVATVSDGNVKAVGKGTATITASFKYNGKTYKATCTVTVKNPSISLSKTSATVNKGSSVTLKATTTPSDKTVTWKSSDTSVAKVSTTGKVTGTGSGTATITASFTYGGKTYKKTCSVTVKSVSAEKTRIDKVKSYIKKYGDIKFRYEYEGVDYYYTISLDDDGHLYFFSMNSYSYDMCVGFSYDYGYDYAEIVGILYSGDDKISILTADVNVAKYNEDYDYTAYASGLSTDSVFNLFFTTVEDGFITWDELLYDEFGFGMNDIGFKSFY